jgi:hypothetical protein
LLCIALLCRFYLTRTEHRLEEQTKQQLKIWLLKKKLEDTKKIFCLVFLATYFTNFVLGHSYYAQFKVMKFKRRIK